MKCVYGVTDATEVHPSACSVLKQRQSYTGLALQANDTTFLDRVWKTVRKKQCSDR